MSNKDFKKDVNKNFNINYKDYFAVTNYLETDGNIDYIYRKTRITDDQIKKSDSDDILVSFERLDAKKTLSVYNYLKYKYFGMINIDDDDDTKSWYRKNINYFDIILNTNDISCILTPSDIFLQRTYTKKNYNGDKTVGRLYNGLSINTLPRELRYFLFKDIYIDIDIANAHPSILYEYSIENKLSLNGSLYDYIYNREAVVDKIGQELGVEENERTKTVKRYVLMYLNKTWDNYYQTPSKTLLNLNEDFEAARNHIWSSYKNGNLSNFEAPLNMSLEDKKDKYTLKDGTVDEQKLLNLSKIVLQCFYCQTQESVHLIRLVNYLRDEYLVYSGDNLKFTDYYPYTNKEVLAGSEHTLFIVPFFDGLYISSPCEVFMEELDNLIKEYNDLSNVIVFVRKDIEKDKNHISDEEIDELRKFTLIFTWLGREDCKYYLDMLLHKKDIHEKLITLLKDDFDTDLIIEEEDEDIVSSDWKDYFQGKIGVIKSAVFDILLEYEFEDEVDINNIISRMETTNITPTYREIIDDD